MIQERRKTITGEDLINAFRTLGFDEYTGPLECFLLKYREANKINTTAYSAKIEVCSYVRVTKQLYKI